MWTDFTLGLPTHSVFHHQLCTLLPQNRLDLQLHYSRSWQALIFQQTESMVLALGKHIPSTFVRLGY
jgi:hypothetical protein